MKYLIILLLYTTLFASNVDELIAKITASKSVSKNLLLSTKSPFGIQSVNKESNTTNQVPPPESTFTLKAIFENTALINDKWVKQGEKLEDYEVFEINAFNVILQGKTKQKKLYLFKGRR